MRAGGMGRAPSCAPVTGFHSSIPSDPATTAICGIGPGRAAITGFWRSRCVRCAVVARNIGSPRIFPVLRSQVKTSPSASRTTRSGVIFTRGFVGTGGSGNGPRSVPSTGASRPDVRGFRELERGPLGEARDAEEVDVALPVPGPGLDEVQLVGGHVVVQVVTGARGQ